jgi:hypothetical protein
MTQTAPWIEDVVLDVAFLLQESLYYGPENRFSEEQWNTFRDPLYRPRLATYGRGRILLGEALTERTELLRYYESVLQTAANRGKVLRPACPEFWLRVVLLSGDEELVSCAWHDTVDEALSLLDAIVSPGDGELYHDIDQGWELQILADETGVQVKQADPDSGMVQAYFQCNRHALTTQAKAANQKLREMVSWLTSELGGNYWSHERRQI